MKTRAFSATRSHRQAANGFTLVELMIALVLGLLIVAGVISLFLGMRASYGFQEGLSRVQENGRFAIQSLSQELRMAGYRGCANPETVTSWLDPTGTGYSDSLFGNRAVTGWEASGTGPGDAYQIGTASNWSGSHGETVATGIGGLVDTADLVPGSDIVLLHRSIELDLEISGPPSSTAATFNLDSANGLPGGAVVLAVPSNCSGGDLWQKQSAASANTLSRGAGGSPGNTAPSSTPFANEYDEDAMLLTRIASVFMVRSNPAGEPALYRLTIDGSAAPAPQELVSGVESMQILFGEDTNDDEAADTYSAADSVTDWDQVVAIRLGLLLRNNERVQSESSLRAYDVAYTDVTPIEEDRVRQVMTLTIALRNRLP